MRCLSLLLLISLSLRLFAQYPPAPDPIQYVNDFAKVLTDEEQRILEQRLKIIDKDTNSPVQFVIVTVSSLKGEKIEKYTQILAEEWGIGDAEKDNGLLLLLAVNEKRIRVELGYGLSEKITDVDAFDVLDRQMYPRLKEGNPYQAFDRAITELLHLIIRENSDETDPDGPNHRSYYRNPIYIEEEPEVPDSDTPNPMVSLYYILAFSIFFFCFYLVVRFGSSSSSSGRTYSSNSKRTTSSSGNYRDYSDYSDYSDSSFGGGSFGGGGATGSW